MNDVAVLVVNMALVNNICLTHLIGIREQISCSARLLLAWYMARAFFFVLTVTVPVNYLVHRFFVEPLSLQAMAVLIDMIVIFFTVQLYQYVGKKICPFQGGSWSVLSPLLLLNSVIIGVVILGQEAIGGFFASLCYGLGAGVGFAAVLLMLTCLRERIQAQRLPRGFIGLPILLITLGIVAMAFNGLTGIAR